MAYAKLGDVSDSNATSLRILRNSDNVTYAVLKEATTIIATLTLVAGNMSSSKKYISQVGYDGTNGSLSPNSFNYNGTQYTISNLYTIHVMKVPLFISGTTVESFTLHVIFSSAPSFTKMVIYIDGEEFELSKDSSDETSFSTDTTDTDKFEFALRVPYTIKILSVS